MQEITGYDFNGGGGIEPESKLDDNFYDDQSFEDQYDTINRWRHMATEELKSQRIEIILIDILGELKIKRLCMIKGQTLEEANLEQKLHHIFFIYFPFSTFNLLFTT